MNFRKRWKRFWTLRRKPDDGFTLVELIVTIAVLGTLAGVGTAGYSGYVKHSHKNVDKTLVGNIVRAIETGTNSMMFMPKDSDTYGTAVYPVGFVVLTTDGTQIIQSTTQKTYVDEPCQFETIENVYVKTAREETSVCGKKTTVCYEVSNEPTVLKYCTVHSTAEPVIQDMGGQQYIADLTSTCSTWSCLLKCNKSQEVPGYYPANAVGVANQDQLKLLKSGTLCELAYAQQNGVYGAASAGAVTSGPLYDSIEAAFGNPAELSLTYEAWTQDEGVSYAPFYTSAPQMVEKIEDLSSTLILGYSAAALLGKEGSLNLTKKFEDATDVLDTFSVEFTKKYGEDQQGWLDLWEDIPNRTYASEGFGFKYRDQYCACRVAYNNGFAAYLQSVGFEKQYGTAYVTAIKDYHSDEVFGVKLPGLVTKSAFADSNSKLKDQITNAASESDAVIKDGAKAFAQIEKLYEAYIQSDAHRENGKVLHDTMVSLAQNRDKALDKDNGYNGDYMAYNKSYMNEMATLYQTMQNVSDSSIVIAVTVEDGTVKCDVSPSAANPRKD